MEGNRKQDSLLDQNRSAVNETVLISENQSAAGTEEELNIASGENKKVVSFLSDQYCEELAHPHLFSTGKFGYKVKREIPLNARKYFNQILLNHSLPKYSHLIQATIFMHVQFFREYS